MQAFFRRLGLNRLWSFFLSRSGAAGGCGALAGAFALCWLQQTVAVFGTSLVMTTGLGAGLALGVTLGLPRRRRTVDSRTAAFQWSGLHFTLAAWTIALPLLAGAVMDSAAWWGVETLSTTWGAILFTTVAGTILLAPPAAVLTRLPFAFNAFTTRDSHDDEAAAASGSHTARWYLSGAAIGASVSVLALSWFADAVLLGMITAAASAAWATAALFHRTPTPASDEQLTTARYPSPVTRHPSPNTQHRAPSTHPVWTYAIILFAGVLTALMQSITAQLLPEETYLTAAAWGGVAFAAALGGSWADRRNRRSVAASPATWATLFAAGWCVAVVALFPQLIELMLSVNAHVSKAWVMLPVRMAIAAAFVAPIGFCLGVCLRVVETITVVGDAASVDEDAGSILHVATLVVSPTRTMRSDRRTDEAPMSRTLPVAFVAGYLAVGWFIANGVETTTMVAVAATALAGLGFAKLIESGVRQPIRRWAPAAMGVACVTTAAVLTTNQFDGSASARLLFRTNVLQMKLAGVDHEFLPVLDEGRLVRTAVGREGAYTVWRRNGSLLHIRRNGVPKAVVSTDPGVCPHPTAEVLQAALPMTLHEAPRHVLLLGLGGGTGLTSCQAYPVETITCVEPDAALVRVLEHDAWSHLSDSPLGKSDVRLWSLAPEAAVAATGEQWDVIISSPDPAALSRSTACLTAEFYRRAAGRLAPEGIFCQRFQYADFGPEPLQTAVATLESVFPTVAAVETAPGEVVFLATSSDRGLIRDGMVERFQRPHVRNLLAQAGWDWVTPLNVSAFDHKALAEFASEDGANVNTAASSRFAFRLPAEVVRWGPKLKEISEKLAGRSSRLLDWRTGEHDDKDLLHRLAELTAQRKIMSKFPDQPWSYRKTLRERVAESRGVIVPVKGELVQDLHPVDKRRKQFFETFGRTVGQSKPSLVEVDRVAAFAVPYDPLLSYFVHEEAAELYARAKERDVKTELRHRLHSVYYADARDRSVRNVCAAIRLIADEPESLDSPLERRDQLDALTQTLKNRWEVRGLVAPLEPQVVLNDIELSVDAFEAAFEVLESLAANEDVGLENWSTRREFLETFAVRPLTEYRAKLTNYDLKKRGQDARAKARRRAAE